MPLTISIVSFNIGVDQHMLRGDRLSNHVGNIRQCVSRLAAEPDTDFVCLTELGGYREGLQDAALPPGTITQGELPGAQVATAGANACLWDLRAPCPLSALR